MFKNYMLFIAFILAIVSSCVLALGDLWADEQVFTIEEGHRISIDKNIGDWVGLPPLKENTACIDKGEYIWKDAKKR